jgi:hypothetical protein
MRMSPVRQHPPAPQPVDGPAPHAYTVLVFDELVHAPWAVVFQADNDAKATAMLRALHASKRRELWCGRRLVAEMR